MPKTRADEVVFELAEGVAASKGYRLVDVKSIKGPRSVRLLIALHRSGGITLDDCESFSRELSRKMDENPETEALFAGSYHLEVSSPGIDRELKTKRELEVFEGEMVSLTVTEGELVLPDKAPSRHGIVILSGILRGFQEDAVRIEMDGVLREIPKAAVRKIRLGSPKGKTHDLGRRN